MVITMKFVDLNIENAGIGMELFDQAVRDHEILYKPFQTEEDFFSFFGAIQKEQLCRISFLEENGKAFASGCYIKGEERAYITFLIVLKKYRRTGIATTMLKKLEERLLENEWIKRIEIIFFNPMAFSWNIPNGHGADHPNAPGIDVASEAYLFFKNCGYRDYATQNSYYIELSSYSIPNSMKEQEAALRSEGITFEYFQENVHRGMPDLLAKLGNPVWEKEILAEVQKGRNARPILIVNCGGNVIGFTGPLDVEISKRGYFAGIGVDSDYRGKGIAKVLFCKLCTALKEKEAEFMTLFTGETNPARNIYEAAGFKIVRTWMNMRKERRADE